MKSYKTYMEKIHDNYYGIYHFKNSGYLLAGLYVYSKGCDYVIYPKHDTSSVVGSNRTEFNGVVDKHREYK